MIKIWNSFPEVLIIDTTHRVIKKNLIKWKFFVLLCINSIGVSEVVCLFQSKDETIETINSVFKKLEL